MQIDYRIWFRIQSHFKSILFLNYSHLDSKTSIKGTSYSNSDLVPTIIWVHSYLTDWKISQPLNVISFCISNKIPYKDFIIVPVYCLIILLSILFSYILDKPLKDSNQDILTYNHSTIEFIRYYCHKYHHIIYLRITK